MYRSLCILLSTANRPSKKLEVPPKERSFSKTMTLAPPAAAVTAAAKPETPDPITTTSISLVIVLMVSLLYLENKSQIPPHPPLLKGGKVGLSIFMVCGCRTRHEGLLRK